MSSQFIPATSSRIWMLLGKAPPCRRSNRQRRRSAEGGWQSGDAWFRGHARGQAPSFHAAPRIDVAAHRIEIVDAAAKRALQRRNATERQILVGTGEPARRARLVGKEQLETLVDAEHERDALNLIAGQRANLAALPVVIGGPRNVAQKSTA